MSIRLVIALATCCIAFGGESFITGRLFDPTGLPVANAKITLRPYESHTATGEEEPAVREGTSKPNGEFMISCAPGQTYDLHIEVPGLNPVEIAKTKADARLGDMRVDGPKDWINPDYKGQLKLEQVIVDPRNWTGKPGNLRPMEVSDRAEQLWPLGTPDNGAHWDRSNERFIPAISIEQFVGGKVKQIRVVRFISSGPVNPDDLERIREEVRRVWFRNVGTASPSIFWAEGSPWNIEAVVDFEDGQHTAILMDDWLHAQVQDRKGRFWFIR
jgi:hypothetical protein